MRYSLFSNSNLPATNFRFDSEIAILFSILISLFLCDLLPSSALVSSFIAELRRRAQGGVELLIPGTFDFQIYCFSIRVIASGLSL